MLKKIAWAPLCALVMVAPQEGHAAGDQPAARPEPTSPSKGAPSAAPETARPWLGLSIEKGEVGVRVREVMPDSPCASVAVHPGDEVLGIEGARVRTPAQLIAAVQRAPVGKTVSLLVRAPQGEERAVEVVLARRPRMEEWQRGALLGRQAPDVAPRVLSGPEMASLASQRGQVVLLHFFASWCGPCMRAIPELIAIDKRYRGRGLRVIGISSETEDLIGKVVRQHGIGYSVAMDVGEKAIRAFRVFAFPTLVLLDREGVVRQIRGAEADDLTTHIEEVLDAQGAAVSPASAGARGR